ncbi:MAG: alanine racemase [Oscillospiraceae bacterium]|nr:alanine racemase [Oscillospiraceae bacterium]
MKLLKRTWANVDMDALAHNYAAIRAHVPGKSKFLGVMKADAYGHGAVPVSHALVELGADYLAVSNLEEAVQLRRGGVRAPILILGYTPPSYAENMIYLDLTQEVHSLEYARQLDMALDGSNFVLNVHLKLDTGMTRIGFTAYGDEACLQDLVQASKLSHLHVEGAFMHFCVADSAAQEDKTFTYLQHERFINALSYMESHGIKPDIRHCCNSGATLMYPEFAMDMIRPGILTYGVNPSEDTKGILELRPMLSLYTSVSQVRQIPAGTDVSYGRTYKTEGDRRLAVLAIGYADGLQRRLSGSVKFMVRGKFVPVVGRICMDMCMVDVTDVPDVQPGNEVMIIGTELPCEDMAYRLDTIAYEILCGINKRIPRIYYQNGKTSEILQYIV